MRSLQRDDVTLAFQLIEADGPTLLFLHGWCCDQTHLAPQMAYFAKRGYRIVALDLRGHGQSSKPRGRYAMEIFADDVAWLCDSLGISKCCLIGHSMGGIVAYESALRRPDLAETIVMIDSAVTWPASARAASAAFLTDLEGPSYRHALATFVVNSLVLASDDRQGVDKIIAGMVLTPQHVVVSAFEALRDYDPAASGKLASPALFIAAGEPQARSDMPRLRELIPQLAFGQTVGSGHFCQLEVPDQVNAMIERFISTICRVDLEREASWQC